MASVILLSEALEDMKRLYGFVAEYDRAAAGKAMRNIRQGIKKLRKFPHIGLIMRSDLPYRELSIPFGSATYVVRYLCTDARSVFVIRVWHSRENRSND